MQGDDAVSENTNITVENGRYRGVTPTSELLMAPGLHRSNAVLRRFRHPWFSGEQDVEAGAGKSYAANSICKNTDAVNELFTQIP
jgi:hypothetical protein